MPRVVVPLVAAAAGTAWLIALFVPWTARGALSSASLLDAVELIRRGAVDAIVPPGAAVLLLVPAIAGIALIGLVGLTGRVAAVVRVGALVLGTAGTLGLAGVLTGFDPAAAGPGVWVAAAGVVAALVVAVLAVSGLRRPSPITPPAGHPPN
ncbi:hypothetical protein [Nocardioides antri]|uniref:Uncharacterized protein n=1 Tax=Nocardioides antri TaxID=2607659 RepID=A0A5B1M739_9ACTN|nr:hypothetical protein [Nocardioides antri]KAA1427560.1 hypothetical protein F0U47_08870 [Nocardioides antri]